MRTAQGRKGQNTVEYLLMLTVVVGVVLVSGMAMKRFMPTLWTQVSGSILSSSQQLGGGN